MVINDCNTPSSVKFISYTGKYPNLCQGVLTLNIDGVEYKFGHDINDYNFDTGKFKDDNYNAFWASGGSCSCYSGCHYEEWLIDASKLPQNIRKYVYDIDNIFNENVEWGCCGGCL